MPQCPIASRGAGTGGQGHTEIYQWGQTWYFDPQIFVGKKYRSVNMDELLKGEVFFGKML